MRLILKRSTIRSLLVTLGVGIALLAVSLPRIGVRYDPGVDADVRIGQAAGIAALVVLAGLAVPAWSLRGARSLVLGRASWLLAAFLLIALIGTPFCVVPLESAAYVLATAAAWIALANLWFAGRTAVARVMGITGLVLSGSMAYAVLTYGVGLGRYVGALTPNHTAQIALAGVFCAYLTRSRIVRLATFGALVFVILAVNSRGSIVAAVIFFATYYGIRAYFRARNPRRFLTAAIVVYPLLFAGVFFAASRAEELIGTLTEVFALYDPGRGLSSGLTGRAEMWRGALEAMRERPFTGYGFRATGNEGIETAHNAFLNLLQEVGIPGLALFLVYYAALFRRNLRHLPVVARLRDDIAQDRYAVVQAVLVSMLALAFLEVHLLNFGFPLGIWNLACLAYSPARALNAPAPARP